MLSNYCKDQEAYNQQHRHNNSDRAYVVMYVQIMALAVPGDEGVRDVNMSITY